MNKIKRALLSVSNKDGIVELARGLEEAGIEIISTGGTAKLLKENRISVKSVSEITGFPEILDGRVKTLHPAIHGALLARSEVPSDLETLEEHQIKPIDMLVVNLYPFEETVKANKTEGENGASIERAVEQIDIGGPTMVRGAAKNYKSKCVVVNPGRYEEILKEMKLSDGIISEETRLILAAEAFRSIAHYDAVIADYFESIQNEESAMYRMPEFLSFSFRQEMTLRYGENPHQTAQLYGNFFKYFRHLHGKELSYNNILDLTAAARLVKEFEQPAVAIIKHNNPCGVAVASDKYGEDLLTAYRKAFECDRVSAFGGIVAINRPLDMQTAEAIDKIFTEVIIAPSFPDVVLEFLKRKKERRIIKQIADIGNIKDLDIRSVIGGVLVQEPDSNRMTAEELEVVTKRKPSAEEIEALLFAWNVAKHVKSNAIVFARNNQSLGIGAGQMSRVDSAKIAILKAGSADLDLAGSVAASDGFFPFADGLSELVNAGATAVIQPGGSKRDGEVIDEANRHNLAMVFTGVRHFRH